MRTSTVRTVVLALACGLTIALVAVSSGSAGKAKVGWERSVDLTATAIPGGARPEVRDRAFRVSWSRAWAVQADTTATGTSNCDGCTADADALQVLYLNRPKKAELNNVAAAWTSECDQCRSTALSVQVVLVRGGTKVLANNRSMAVNAGCSSCESSAAAYQLVVVDTNGDNLSSREMDRLRAWVRRQQRALAAESVDAGRRSRSTVGRPAADVSAIENLVTGAVDGRAVVTDADLVDGE